MRQYYASDKKRREDAKRKHQAEKRMKKLKKSQSAAQEDQANVTATEMGSKLPDTPQ